MQSYTNFTLNQKGLTSYLHFVSSKKVSKLWLLLPFNNDDSKQLSWQVEGPLTELNPDDIAAGSHTDFII